MDRRRTYLWIGLAFLATIGPLLALGGFLATLFTLNFDFLVATVCIVAAILFLLFAIAVLAR